MPIVIKADGLAAGKGVVIAQNQNEAISAIQSSFSGAFGEAGKTVLIEECLIGEELSIFAVCDGKNYKILNTMQKNKV